jgi:hypothetical protein
MVANNNSAQFGAQHKRHQSKMEADIFSLFDPNCLKSILSDLNRHNELIKDFARFLSAYFANLPLICSKTKRLPSLFYPANYVDYYEINRQDVSIKLPITYSPSLAVQLLFKCGLLLETTFYVEHFNDIRSALIIRHLVDIKYGYFLINKPNHFILVLNYSTTIVIRN